MPTVLSGWGRSPRVEGRQLLSEELEDICAGAVLSRGLGRSYGDASLPPSPTAAVAGTHLADRLLAFDEQAGIVRAEAGLSLRALTDLVLPRGLTVPVVPGTGQVTLGGMVAADVHGKNHHVKGSLGAHLRGLTMLTADGRRVHTGPEQERDLFEATVGGMGLTGHILEVELALERVPTPWILMEEQPAADLEAVLASLDEAGRSWPFTVAWVDALVRGAARGRGLVLKGRWAARGEAPPRLAPRRVTSGGLARASRLVPSALLRPSTVRAFDALHHARHARWPRQGLVTPEAFFHPLDRLPDWNRLYGERGFVQHQCVLPAGGGHRPVVRLFEALVAAGGHSYLTVIKDFGREGPGLMSFPRPGTTVTLDLPMEGPRTQGVVDALNAVVMDEGGRVYMAKDALTRAEHFAAMEGERLAAFDAARRRWDPDRKLRSALSVRLLGDEP